MTQPTVKELRVALTVDDIERSIRLYRDHLGLQVVKEWATPDGRGVVLAAGHATLELIDRAQADFIDQVEVGQRVAGPVRLAFEFTDVDQAVAAGEAGGAHLLHAPVRTPWNDRNARLADPDGMQLTFFQLLDAQDAESDEASSSGARL